MLVCRQRNNHILQSAWLLREANLMLETLSIPIAVIIEMNEYIIWILNIII